MLHNVQNLLNLYARLYLLNYTIFYLTIDLMENLFNHLLHLLTKAYYYQKYLYYDKLICKDLEIINYSMEYQIYYFII